MAILGVDWGEKKVGLALGVGKIAEPYEVIRYSDINLLKETLKEILDKEKIDKIVVGVSEAESGLKARKFGAEVLGNLGREVVYFDETLSTAQAQELSRQAGIKRKKRKALEDAFAASIMLQSFLDSYV